jgi:hypothetical protein
MVLSSVLLSAMLDRCVCRGVVSLELFVCVSIVDDRESRRAVPIAPGPGSRIISRQKGVSSETDEIDDIAISVQ